MMVAPMPNKEESVLEDFIGTVCTEIFVRISQTIISTGSIIFFKKLPISAIMKIV